MRASCRINCARTYVYSATGGHYANGSDPILSLSRHRRQSSSALVRESRISGAASRYSAGFVRPLQPPGFARRSYSVEASTATPQGAAEGEGQKATIPPHRSRLLSPFLLPVAWVVERYGAWRWLRYELDKAERSMRRALKLRERVYGAEHPDLCNHLAPYATLQRMRGELAQARALNERVVRICEKYAGQNSFLTALALHDLGIVTEDLGKGDDAEQIYRRSIDLMGRAVRTLPEGEDEAKRKATMEHNENVEAKVMDVKCDLVVLLEHMGKHGEALPLHDEVFQKAWNVDRWDHPFFHSHLHSSKSWRLEHFLETQRLAAGSPEMEARRREVESMGEKDGSYIRIKRPEDDNGEGWTPGSARPRPADDTQEATTGQHTVSELKDEVKEALAKLDREYLKKTREITEELAYRKVVDKLSTTLGAEHPALCRHLYYMAHVYMENERYPEAETMVKRVLSIQKRERGPFSVPTATAWGVLADLCLRQRNHEDAARLLAQALERKREVLGTGHVAVGVLEYEMSGVAQEMAKFNTAIGCLKRARSIFSLIPLAKTGEEHSEHPWVTVVRTRAEELKRTKEEAMSKFIKQNDSATESSGFIDSPGHRDVNDGEASFLLGGSQEGGATQAAQPEEPLHHLAFRGRERLSK